MLNGLGGKELYAERFREESQELQRQGYRVGRATSLIQAAGLGLPTLFLAVVVWLAARLAVQGTISVGGLVAVFGYAAVLMVPVSSFIESAVDISRALVAGRRVTDFLSLKRDDDELEATVPAHGDIIDTVSGLGIPAGKFTVIATARQADAAALVDRVAGFRPGATWHGQPVDSMNPVALRERLLVADNDAYLFAGTLAEVVSGRRDVNEGEVQQALELAAADDLGHSLPDGLESRIDSRGNNLSGGQRQRVRLARAIMARPSVLLAVDPTSAVDAVTEANIVNRLVQARRGSTTVVTSTSALMLAAADQVHFLAGDRVVTTGTHTDLLRDEPSYAALVLRGTAGDDPSDSGEDVA